MMTANPTVPADVWACKQPGVPLVAAIVEGECVHCGPRVGWHHDLDCGGVQLDPPAWLVALRDAQCETCWALGVAMDNPDDLYYSDELEAFTVDGDIRTKPCPDCRNGRVLHDVLVECRERKYHGPRNPRCPTERTVRCLVDVVPVYHVNALGDQWPALFVIGSFVLRAEKNITPSFALTPAHVDALAAACGKPPADWVGGYAVILTTADQEAE